MPASLVRRRWATGLSLGFSFGTGSMAIASGVLLPRLGRLVASVSTVADRWGVSMFEGRRERLDDRGQWAGGECDDVSAEWNERQVEAGLLMGASQVIFGGASGPGPCFPSVLR